jgi:3-methyladenine DNA glycosylase AlkD
MIKQLILEMKKQADSDRKKNLSRFFKAGKGEYGEGDVFLGITVPVQRENAKKYITLELKEIQLLLKSKFHEHRLTGLIILTLKYKKADENEKKQIFDFYLKNTKYINNWDLVDLTAPNIIGNYLLDKDRSLIHKLSHSKKFWERRIAVLATFTFIRNNQFQDTLRVTKTLIKDKHDLIQKAVGWMLRELGKRDLKTEEKFLKKYCKQMGRTALRYAIEKFPEEKRKYYLSV